MDILFRHTYSDLSDFDVVFHLLPLNKKRRPQLAAKTTVLNYSGAGVLPFHTTREASSPPPRFCGDLEFAPRNLLCYRFSRYPVTSFARGIPRLFRDYVMQDVFPDNRPHTDAIGGGICRWIRI
jgi:hypothetical protein